MKVNLPNLNFLAATRGFQGLVAFVALVMAAVTIGNTRSYDFVYGQDVYTLLLSILTGVFLGVTRGAMLTMDQGKTMYILQAVCEAALNVMWFASFISTAVAHAACSTDKIEDKKQKKEKDPSYCGVGKGLIVVCCFTWLVFCATSFLVGRQVWILYSDEKRQAATTDAEHLAGYHEGPPQEQQQQQQHYGYNPNDPYGTGNPATPYPRDDASAYDDSHQKFPDYPYHSTQPRRGSWESRESMESIKLKY